MGPVTIGVLLAAVLAVVVFFFARNFSRVRDRQVRKADDYAEHRARDIELHRHTDAEAR